MDTELLIRDNQSGSLYNASELLISAAWSGQIGEQPGKLEFDVVRDGTLQFYEGSPVTLRTDGQDVFSGWVFSKTRRDDNTTSAIAYDQQRYLKNSDTYVFSGKSASEIFQAVCGDFSLQCRVVHPSAYTLPDKIYDNKSLGYMIQDSINLTQDSAGKRYFLRDNFGVLEFLEVSKLRTDLVVGEGSLMTGYDYQTSIDEDTYNQVKLVRGQGEDGGRLTAVESDGETIGHWGLLQYYETVEESANQAQLAQRASQLLALKNRVSRTLSLDCIGDWRALPGNSVWVETALDDMQVSRYMTVSACRHTLKNNLHTMNLTLEVDE